MLMWIGAEILEQRISGFARPWADRRLAASGCLWCRRLTESCAILHSEEECLVTIGVVNVGNEQRAAEVAAEDVVVGIRLGPGNGLFRVVGRRAVEFKERTVDISACRS